MYTFIQNNTGVLYMPVSKKTAKIRPIPLENIIVPSAKKIKKKSTSSKKTKKKSGSRSVKKTKKNISKNVDVNLMAFKWPQSLSNHIPYTEDTIFPNHSYDYQQSLDPQQSQIIPYNPYSAYQESPQQYITPNTKSPMKCTTKTSTSNGIVMKTTICKCDGVNCIGSSNTHGLFDSIRNMPHMIQMEGGRRKKMRPHPR